MRLKDQIKSKVCDHIVDYINVYGLSQKEAASIMQTSQPRVSHIVHKQMALLSLDFVVDKYELLEQHYKT